LKPQKRGLRWDKKAMVMKEQRKMPVGRPRERNEMLTCVECFRCITRMFRNVPELEEWCHRMEVEIKHTWVDKIRKNNDVRLYWCRVENLWNTSGRIRPRMVLDTTHTKKFIQDCKVEETE